MEYKSAYIVTNENLRWTTKVVPGVSRVLTVAASGDQTLFYKLAGARVVDTFDITHYAGVIQDIKYAAIKCLDYTDYIALLRQLCDRIPMMDIPQMKKIQRYLTKQSRKTMATTDILPLFNTIDEFEQAYKTNMPKYDEYMRLKQILNKSFRFTQSDVQCIANKISGKYDLINISNILDYGEYRPKSKEIIAHVGKLLRTGGYIADCIQYRNNPIVHFQPEDQKDITIKCTQVITDPISKQTILLYQRTR